MKKATRNILATLAVAVVLGGAAAALLLTQPDTDEDTSSVSSASSTTSISLYSYEDSEIESISITNANGGYTILARTETVSSASSEETDSDEEEETTATTFYIDGIDESLQNTSTVSSAASYATSLSAVSEIGAAEELSLEDYGLAEPAATIKTMLTDGTEVAYSVGNESPVTGTYILYDDTVYAASVGTYWEKNSLDFVLTTILTITPPESTDDSFSDSSSTSDTNEYTQFVFTGSNFPQEVRIIPQNDLTSAYKLVEPYEVSVNTTAIDTLISGIESLTASSVAAVDPTPEQLEEFGLDTPLGSDEGFRKRQRIHTSFRQA